VQEQFKNALGEASPLFVASIIDAYGSSKDLQQCEPSAVIREALKAAVLRLPIARGLGFAYIVPRRDRGTMAPQMQIGWRGWVQLAQRTGQYRHINVGSIYEGERVIVDRLTGEVTIEGEATGDAPIGYFAYIETIGGFKKAIAWSVAKMNAHRDRYVPGWNRPGSAWMTHPEEMAHKTVISALIRKWGVTSVEMQRAVEADSEQSDGGGQYPNAEPIDITPAPSGTPAPVRIAKQQAVPAAPAWIADLAERVDAYRRPHGGELPDGYPEELRDEKVASRWIDRLDETAAREQGSEEAEF
jgi:recombination protein RecT